MSTLRLWAVGVVEVVAAAAATACGAGIGPTSGATSAAGPPSGATRLPAGATAAPAGDTADCPLPSTPIPSAAASTSIGIGIGTASVGTATVGGIGTAVGHVGGAAPGATESSTTASATFPGLAGVSLPSEAAHPSPGDVRVEAGGATRAVAVRRGAHVLLVYGAQAALLPIGNTDTSVLRDDGRSCNPDGSAVRTFTAVMHGMSVLLLQFGPRCLNSRPRCLPAVAEVPLRVDVVA